MSSFFESLSKSSPIQYNPLASQQQQLVKPPTSFASPQAILPSISPSYQSSNGQQQPSRQTMYPSTAPSYQPQQRMPSSSSQSTLYTPLMSVNSNTNMSLSTYMTPNRIPIASPPIGYRYGLTEEDIKMDGCDSVNNYSKMN